MTYHEFSRGTKLRRNLSGTLHAAPGMLIKSLIYMVLWIYLLQCAKDKLCASFSQPLFGQQQNLQML